MSPKKLATKDGPLNHNESITNKLSDKIIVYNHERKIITIVAISAKYHNKFKIIFEYLTNVRMELNNITGEKWFLNQIKVIIQCCITHL